VIVECWDLEHRCQILVHGLIRVVMVMVMANNNAREALKRGTRGREIILGIGITERLGITERRREVRREVRRNEYSKK